MRLEVLLSDHVEMYSFESIDIHSYQLLKKVLEKKNFINIFNYEA